MVSDDGPDRCSTDDKCHRKDNSECGPGDRERIAETNDPELIVEISEEAENGSTDLADPHVEDSIEVCSTRVHASPCGGTGQEVVNDEDDSIVPNDCVVHILDLIGKEQEEDLLCGGMVRKEALLVIGLYHGFGSSQGVVLEVIHNVQVLYSHVPNGETREGVDANVAGEDVPVGLILEQIMRVL